MANKFRCCADCCLNVWGYSATCECCVLGSNFVRKKRTVQFDYTPDYIQKAVAYCQADIDMTKATLVNIRNTFNPFAIKNVVFNNPATIVFWMDGTKTVVKCGEEEDYDPEKGLAMAIAKKALGNKGNYYNEIRKWVEPEIMAERESVKDFLELLRRINDKEGK